MPPKKIADFNEVITNLHKFNHKDLAFGYYAFCIVTKDEEGLFTIHERDREPCYGGLRKYKSTHKGDCTQPDHKPGDLHNPFPEGEPVAVGFSFSALKYLDSYYLFEACWGDTSPWIKGFGSRENIEVTYTEDGKILGVILKNTDIDPTVLVNLAKFTKAMTQHQEETFNSLVKEGLDTHEALAVMTYNSGHLTPMGANGYTFSQVVDFKRFKSGDAKDHTGGTLRQRFDYSRKQLHNLFYDRKGLNLAQELRAAGLTGSQPTPKKFVEVAKEIFKKYS